MDVALLVLRLVVGVTLLCHAAQKGPGWFRGPGLTRSAEVFESLGQAPGTVKVRLAITCELCAGVLLILGLATPLAAAVGAGTMLVAAGSMAQKARVFWNALGGGEYPFVLAMIVLSLGFSGPGRYALDPLILDDPPAWAGAAVAAVAVLAAVPPLLQARRQLRRMTPLEAS